MTDIIDKVKLKHTLYTTLIAGLVLLVLLGGFFGLLSASVSGNARDTMQKALDKYDQIQPSFESGARCFCFYISDGETYYYPAYAHDVAYYGSDAVKIMSNAASVGNGSFSYGDNFFYVASQTRADGVTNYAVYDATTDRFFLVRVLMILVSLYMISLVVITVLAYAFSATTTAPLKKAMTMQRDLVTNASHELKTPLAVISTDLSVMKSDLKSSIEDNQKWIESIDGQILRMDGLIKSMLELSKLEQATLKKEIVDFSGIVSVACLEFEAICFEKHVELLTCISDNVYVYGEKTSLERLVTILLDNAVKYCGKNGKVGCKLTVDKKIRLTLMNTGQAISNEEAKHVFDRFYRSDGARSNPDGNSFGLGLSIAQATVVAHDGTITCKGVENKGSVFEVNLPLPKKKELNDSNINAKKANIRNKKLKDSRISTDSDNVNAQGDFDFSNDDSFDVLLNSHDKENTATSEACDVLKQSSEPLDEEIDKV